MHNSSFTFYFKQLNKKFIKILSGCAKCWSRITVHTKDSQNHDAHGSKWHDIG